MLKLPAIYGVIDRRILANYQVAPEVLSRILPEPFRPKIINGVGIAGICLIRLRQIRPRFVPGKFGLSSENAAHRIAVEWTEGGRACEGVYVPRRDTASKLNATLGGTVFPGFHQRARFRVFEQGDFYSVALDSADGVTHVRVDGRVSSALPAGSAFQSLGQASEFFATGSVGYSARPTPGVYDGLELHSLNWKIEPLAVERIESSFFDDPARFPAGSARFDCALIMRGIRHQWQAREPLCPATMAR